MNLIRTSNIIVLLNLFLSFFAFITSFLLAKFSADAVGIFSSFNMFIYTISTLIMFGGINVLSVFYTDNPSKSEKIKIFNFYFIFGLPILLLSIIFMYFMDGFIFEKLLHFHIDFHFIVLIFFSIYISKLLIFFINAQKMVKLASFVDKINQLTFLMLPILLFFGNFSDYLLYIIIIFLGTNFTKIFITYKYSNYQLILSVQNPNRFFHLSIPLYLQSITILIYSVLDRYIVLNYFDLTMLGIYHIIILLWETPRMLIGNLSQSLLPFMSTDMSKTQFNHLTAYVTLISYIFSTSVIFFGPEILAHFGSQYNQYSSILLILSIFTVIAAPGVVIMPFLNVLFKTHITYITSLFQIIIQLCFIYLLIDDYGIYAVAYSKGAGVLLSVLMMYLYTKSVRGYSLPLHYYSLVIISILSVLVIIIGEPSIATKVVVFVFILSIIFFQRKKWSKVVND